MRASWMLTPAPYRAKDFCIVKARDGLYHVFYIRNNVTLPTAQTEVDFGHAVTPNFWTWSQLPPVLAVTDSAWDDQHVWAPSIVEKDSVYYMFYTGVRYQPGVYNSFQRIGVATSTDLMTWNRMDAPVFACDSVPWAYCQPVDAKCAFRDPFVMPDPARPGAWLMYYAASVPADTSMVVGVARSDGDLLQWRDDKPLWNTYYTTTLGYITESPHVFLYHDLWYLFYTTVQPQPLQFQTSADPTGDPAAWTPRGSLGSMLGLNTAAWYASEHVQDGLLDLLAFVEYDRVTVYRMVGAAGDWRFSLAQPDRFRVLRMGWGADSARVNDPVSLTLNGIESSGKTAALEVAELFPDGSERLVAPDSLGIDSTVAMTSDSTVVTWNARTLADSTDTTRVLRLVVRLRDHTATTRPLTVVRDTAVVDTLPPPPPPQDPPPGDDPDPGTTDTGLIRPLRYSPYGLPAVLVQMARTAHARVAVFDLQGRRVRVLADRDLARGANVLTWDGRAADGARAGAGVYFVRLEAGRTRSVARLILLP